jgi:proton-translocating NAD(P)+ transhydrogenase subunit beta
VDHQFLLPEAWIELVYLVAAALFIYGLKGLTHPRTAVRGNLLGAVGMFIAMLATALAVGLDYASIIIGIAIGGLIGAVAAYKVKMTAMPEMVALFNGFGGAASVLVAGAAFAVALPHGQPGMQTTIATGLSGLIGGVTFSGSFIAFLKLNETIKRNLYFPGQQLLNLLLLLGSLALTAWMVLGGGMPPYWVLSALSLLLGMFLTMGIGGADMPVVIALLNSYSGLAAAATGFVLGNDLLIIAGSLVGASGVILTNIMCKAMNRSLPNVLFGRFGGGSDGPTADEVYGGKVKATSPEEVAMLLDGVQRVVIVPGYGMAVAQAQHVVRDLGTLLEQRGATVEYAIHPVAGRMPGHMNVLLAEADVPYDKLIEMDAINPTMDQVDVAIVIGANDVVNPVARSDPQSPIAGMPIIDVDKARTVIVVKRSLSPGFAGIPNPLFAADNTLMMFGDGKKAIMELSAALKET